MRKVEVVPYNPKWREMFKVESKRITEVLGENIVNLHHIGSTAIPNIYAKPIIDLLIEVKYIAKVDDFDSQMESLGYEVMGEFGIVGRRYFRKHNHEGVRTHHIHIFEFGSKQIERHLAFRNYMIVHPEEAQKYSKLKCELAKKYPTNIEQYMDGKDSFIQAIDKKAGQFYSTIASLNELCNSDHA